MLRPRPVSLWCEAAAYTPNGTGYWLDSTPARTPRLALRWLRSRAQDIADQLDDPSAQPVRYWLTDEPEHERALHLLAHGLPYALTAYEDSTRYILTARPTT